MTRKTPASSRTHPQAQATPQAPRTPGEPHDLTPAPPVTPSPHLLNPGHARFCQEYIVDLNGTKAYKRAYPESGDNASAHSASLLLDRPEIRNEIQRLMDERAIITGITADRVLTRLWAIATADARELTGYRIGACRHCWGEYHQHQYTELELEKAEHEWIQAEAKRRRAEKGDFVPRHFPRKGGTGFNPKRAPHPDCPECFGEGKGTVYLNDTGRLSESGAMLFKGMRQTQHGVNMELHDPLAALHLVGKHLGLWNDKVPGPQETNPLRALLEQIQGRSGAGAALPVVADDPEIAPRGDITDVVVKRRTPKPGVGGKTLSKSWRPA